MADYVLVRHKVRDFAEWKAAHSAHRPKRIEAGLTDEKLLRSADDPNNVFLLMEIVDPNRAQAFAQSDDLRDTMQKAGVIEKPDIYFLSD